MSITNDTNMPLYYNKNDILGENKISLQLFSCENIYDMEMPLSELYIHNFTEITVIVAGKGIHRVLNQELPCKAGDIFITPPDIPHGFFLSDSKEQLVGRKLMFNVGDWFYKEIAIQGNPRFCYGVFNDNATIAYAMLNEKLQKEIDVVFNSIEKEVSERKAEWQDMTRGYLTKLLITVSRYINCTIKNIPSNPSKEWATVLSTIRMVRERYDDYELTLESIADSLYVSKSHISRAFKKLMGEYFSDYLKRIRLDKACYLLKKTDMKVEDIVVSCGLRDIHSFYNSFSAYVHMTPHQYRHSAADAVERSDINKKQKTKGANIMSILNEISTNLQLGKANVVKELVQQAIDAGSNPAEILKEGLLAGMGVIGEKFKNNEVYVPEVLVAARAMNMGVQVLKPYLSSEDSTSKGRVCIGTVQGDLHDIGKNLVRMMMEGKGLEVIDLGTDVSPETFVQTAIEKDCQVICCSALLTTTMGVMEEVVKAAENAGIRDKVKIMIGGAPVSAEFAEKVGADCYTVDAASAADAAVEFCNA
ncbi:MAG: cobalamin-dependent protein [Clostridia bacterium]|nr:cobalamin-dependent protein [Clostridia bacterium]